MYLCGRLDMRISTHSIADIHLFGEGSGAGVRCRQSWQLVADNVLSSHQGGTRPVCFSALPNLKELIIQKGGHPYRVFYLFGANRKALLLTGARKDGSNDKLFYKTMISPGGR